MSRFIECFLCGNITLKEQVDAENNLTVFCTSRKCGRYKLTQSCLASLESGCVFKIPEDQLCHEVYMANRAAKQVIFSNEHLADPDSTWRTDLDNLNRIERETASVTASPPSRSFPHVTSGNRSEQ